MPKLHIPLPAGSTWRTTLIWALGWFVVLACADICREYPPLPRTLGLKIVFPPGITGQLEPLISAGAFEAADFFDIRYDSPTTARFGYDFWGAGGPVSEPFTFVPGQTYALEIEMPSLAETSAFPPQTKGRFRAVLDGRELLNADVSFHRRDSTELFFGTNPIGGTTADARFRGALSTPEGRVLRGGPESYFSWRTRFASWLRHSASRLILFALCGLLIAVSGSWLAAWQRTPSTASNSSATPNRTPQHGWFVATAVICAVVFVWMLTGNTWNLLYEEVFANFYDYQAVSLLHGRLDVPEAALSGESFIFDGKIYGYFGPTPAVLRLPLMMLGVGFGHLSRLFMLIDYLAALAGAYALLCYATQFVRGAGTYPSRFATIVFTVSVGLASTLFFLSGRAYIYHEAIACGVAFTLWSAYCSLRFLEARASRWWLGALLCGIAAVHARPPIGFFALSLLGVVAATHLIRSVYAQGGWQKPIAVGLLAAAAILSYNGLSYLKFGTIEGCPLRYNVQYTPERLAKIDGRQFHWRNVPYSIDCYFLKIPVGLGKDFPYFYMSRLDTGKYPSAKIDLTEPMVSVPYAMPGLFLLTLAAIGQSVVPGSRVRLPLIILLVATLPMAFAMFAAIAVSHRYTADFLGVFVAAAAFGLASLDCHKRRAQTAVRSILGAIVAAGACVTIALTLNFQGTLVWGQPKEVLERYGRLRDRAQQIERWLQKF